MSEQAEVYEVAISNDDYHSLPGVSNSRLKDFMDDPRIYWHKHLSGRHVKKREDHFDFGQAVHDLCLQGSAANIVVIPNDVLSKSGSRAGCAWKEFEAANQGKELLKQHDYYAVLRCVDAVKSHPVGASLLGAPGPVEKAYFHWHQELELNLRCKPDKISYLPSKIVGVDLKTTATGSRADKFVRNVANFGYHFQEHFYRKVLAANNIELSEFVFIVVNVDEPHTVDCYTLSDEFRRLAEADVENGLFALAERTRANDWQVASDSIVELSPPGYLRFKGDYQL